MLKHRVNHTREVIIEEFDGLLSAQAFRDTGIAADIREDNGGFAPYTAEGLTRRIFQDLLDNISGHIAHQGVFDPFFPADVFKP